MDANVVAETLSAFKRRRPVQPFTVVAVSGQRHEIDFPDALAVRGGLALLAGPGSVPVIFDHGSVDEVVGDLAGNPMTA